MNKKLGIHCLIQHTSSRGGCSYTPLIREGLQASVRWVTVHVGPVPQTLAPVPHWATLLGQRLECTGVSSPGSWG